MRSLSLLAFLMLGSPPAARADASPADERTVDLVVAGTAENTAALEEVAGELLRRLDCGLRTSRIDRLEASAVVTPDPSAPPAVARAWIDLATAPGPDGSGQAVLYLVDPAWERIRVRRVPLDDGVDEVVREELAHMLASGVQGLLAGLPLEQTRDEVRVELGVPAPPPAPPPVPVSPPAEPRTLALDLGVGYDVMVFSDAAWVSHGPVAALGLALRRVMLRPALWLTLQYRAPLEADGDPIGVRLDQGVFRLLTSFDVPLVRRFALTVLLGGGIDVVRSTPQLAPHATGRLEAPSTAVYGVVRGMVGFRARLFGATDLLFAIGCDVDGEQRTWFARRDDIEQVVLEPWIARPFVLLTVVTDLPAGPGAGDADDE